RFYRQDIIIAPKRGGDHPADQIEGKLIVFNDNGAWSWFQDDRAIVDPVAGTLLVGSVPNKQGIDGERRDRSIELETYHLESGQRSSFTLHGKLEPDDHNSPALLIRTDGRYVAAYTGHNLDRLTRWRVSLHPHDPTQWTPEQTFDWSKPPASCGKNKV